MQHNTGDGSGGSNRGWAARLFDEADDPVKRLEGFIDRKRPTDMQSMETAARALTGMWFSAKPGGPLEYLFHAFNDEERGARDSVVWACRGGGKTYLGAVATMLDLVFKPGIQVRILAGSLQQAGRMHAHLRGLFARPGLAEMVRGRITATSLRLENGSCVELLAQSQASVRGTRVHRLRCDEVELFDRAVWEAAQLVTRSEELGGCMVRGSIEALSTMHLPFGLMHDIVEDAAASGRRVFKWGVPSVLAPCECERVENEEQREAKKAECVIRDACEACAAEELLVGKEQRGRGHMLIRDVIVMRKRVARDIWNSEMLCLRPTRRDTVFPEFDRDVHVVDELPACAVVGGTWVCGMDFGIRTSAVLWGVWDRETDVLCIVEERVAHNEIVADQLRAIAGSRWPEPAWTGVDPAGGQRSDQSNETNIDILRRGGLCVRDRRLGTRNGIDLVRARLREAAGSVRLLVHERCKGLIAALATHHYDPHRPHATEPVKDGTDHVADALRYMVVNMDKAYAARHGEWA